MSLIRESPPPPEWGVEIDPVSIASLARSWAHRSFDAPTFDYPGLPPWTGSPWYDFCFLGCSVIACLWPPDGDPVWHAQLDGDWLDDAPGLFACFTRRPDLTVQDFRRFDLAAAEVFFAGQGELQLLGARAERLAAVAEALVTQWDGHAINVLDAARWEGPESVRLLVDTIPGYRDEASTQLGPLAFNKLAHLCVAMISTRAERPITMLDTFPVYPDYMLPRFLRHQGILRYEPELALAVDRRQLIRPGSSWELAIRWATVYSADRLADELTAIGNPVSVPALDYAMWHEAVLGPEAAHMGEHHRTLTMAY